MARHLALPGSFHRLLASRHYPPSSPAPPPRPLLLLPKTLIPPAAAAMEFPRRGRRDVAAASAPASSSPETEVAPGAWGKVSAVLFDMDGVLCNSEELSRLAGVDLFAEMGVDVTGDDFVPYMGTGEANFLGGVAKLKGVKDFNAESAKKRFFEIYLDKYAKPNAGIGFPGALDLVTECKNAGLKVAVASSADRIKVDANLAAAGLPLSLFDAIVSADAFENLKPAPDIFLAASKTLGVDTDECIVIEDALAGVQAAKAAEMRCIAVMTTLEEDALQQASPSLIRKNIGDISIRDILYGGSNAYHNERTENTENISSLKPSTEILNGATNAESAPSTNSASSIDDSREGPCSLYLPKGCLIISRVEIVRYLLVMKDLKGRVVLLDFWTYCCINCMHVLPDLEFIEKKYKDKPFTVVGVHSAKFDNEKDLEAIRNAVLRYNITHPVVNDGDMYLWRELGVNSWPTFVVIGPNGKVLAQISGEGHRKDLDDVVGAALEFYEENKLLQNSSLPLALEKDKDSRLLASPLKFPGKLAIDVVTNLEGEFICQIGSSEEGLLDGTFDTASFNRPQGLAYNSKKNILYVADTENHALRTLTWFIVLSLHVILISDCHMFTIAYYTVSTSQNINIGKLKVLNSPWDVCYDPSKETLYIAMAGQHQIWKHNTLDGVTEVLSGDGYERNLNGSSYPLCINEHFGDHDGTGSDVLLQHPLGVVYASDNQIYVADSYNHKIKRLDPVTRKVTTIAGTGRAGYKDGPALSAQLSEPAGLVEVGDGRLLVADTNNSTIRYIVLNEKGAEVRTLDLIGVQPPSPKPKTLKRLRRRLSADTDVINIDGGSSIEGYLSLAISVPDGYHFSKEARSKFDVDIEPADAIEIEPVNGFLNSGQASLKYRRKSSSSSTGRINCKVYYCKEDEVCLYQSVAFDVKFREEAVPSPAQITLSYSVVPRDTSSSAQLIAAGKNGKV
uniref:Thioredoxin domain-containing protein n=1 Tax=Oryza glumipatula TaxID=40148 RepID=A0A0D9Z6B3_9ORYZ